MKNEALAVLKNRRSIRKFKPEQIKDEELEMVLEAGTYAPTTMGRQTPVLVVVQDEETRAKINALNTFQTDKTDPPQRYYNAPTIVLVLVPQDAESGVVDATFVAGNLLNAAYAAGLGSCCIYCIDGMFDSAEARELLRKWGLPETMRCAISVALGYADGPHPDAAPRKADYIVRA